MPGISIPDIDEMTLLELDERVEFLLEIQRERERHKLKDLSHLIYLGCAFGFGVTQSKKIKESDFHKAVDQLLNIKYDQDDSPENPEIDAESALNSIFG